MFSFNNKTHTQTQIPLTGDTRKPRRPGEGLQANPDKGRLSTAVLKMLGACWRRTSVRGLTRVYVTCASFRPLTEAAYYPDPELKSLKDQRTMRCRTTDAEQEETQHRRNLTGIQGNCVTETNTARESRPLARANGQHSCRSLSPRNLRDGQPGRHCPPWLRRHCNAGTPRYWFESQLLHLNPAPR